MKAPTYKSLKDWQEKWKRDGGSWQTSYEKLVEEECLAEPFYACYQLDIDFQPFLQLFKKGDKFWKLARKNLKDEEFEKLVQIYIASEKITWSNLTSDMFLAKPRTGEAEGGKSSARITDLICLTYDVKF